MATSLIDSLKNHKVKITISLFGEERTLTATLGEYAKPFIELRVGNITRIFNEYAVKEIIIIEA